MSMSVFPGEVHALVGENGAGKSTLLKIMFGAYQPDRGTIEIQGRAVILRSPATAIRYGLAMVHQEISLIPQLNAIQNIVLGWEASRLGLIDWADARVRASEALRRLGFRANPMTPVGQLSVAQQQIIELARAVAMDARVIILDEPTATLSMQETEHLFAIIRELKASGHALVYVSHRLPEVFELADRVTVLRDGHLVGTLTRDENFTDATLIRMMVGRQPEVQGTQSGTDTSSALAGEEILRVEGLTRNGIFHDISLTLRRGEVVGVAGMVGSGRTEVVRCIAGADRADHGAIYVRGKHIHLRSPLDAIKVGIAFLPEDRKLQGLILGMSVATNITLPALPTRFGWISRRQQRDLAHAALRQIGTNLEVNRQVRQLSGGTQQKVVLAKWLVTGSDIFLFDEPTRGIDIGAKAEIYRLMHQLKARGAAILMVSSELPEILRMSDRILVMRSGQIVAELQRSEASEEIIVMYASGGKP
ncbi:sugar ABC transporter ATP-binding protein [Thermogemmatispora tikiterensis]|uniref:sugar ABC transporter ATP-binding protein n=1 Tax=Thermogemmatispora tikiterensis TaxID=1825093 RepID=UPI0021D527B2|nr:sugar ABC transporter ATP-binding protein [Thermogemmatispora tikiterensis]